MQVEHDLGVALQERLDDIRQDITGLGVRGADRQAPPALVAQLRGQLPDALRLLQDVQRPVDDLLAGRGDAGEVAALADEDLEAQLVLEQLDLLADPGLGGMQLLGRGGDVQPALRDGGQVTQLVQFHARKPNPTATGS